MIKTLRTSSRAQVPSNRWSMASAPRPIPPHRHTHQMHTRATPPLPAVERQMSVQLCPVKWNEKKGAWESDWARATSKLPIPINAHANLRTVVAELKSWGSLQRRYQTAQSAVSTPIKARSPDFHHLETLSTFVNLQIAIARPDILAGSGTTRHLVQGIEDHPSFWREEVGHQPMKVTAMGGHLCVKDDERWRSDAMSIRGWSKDKDLGEVANHLYEELDGIPILSRGTQYCSEIGKEGEATSDGFRRCPRGNLMG